MHKEILNRDLTFLGLMKKAGKIDIGDEAVSASANKGRAKLIMTAKDASEGAKKRAKFYADTNGVNYMNTRWTKSTLGKVLGRNDIAMIALTDKGMADKLTEISADNNLEE